MYLVTKNIKFIKIVDSILNKEPVKRAENSLKRAKNRLSDQSINLSRAQASVKRAQNRLKIIKKMN